MSVFFSFITVNGMKWMEMRFTTFRRSMIWKTLAQIFVSQISLLHGRPRIWIPQRKQDEKEESWTDYHKSVWMLFIPCISMLICGMWMKWFLLFIGIFQWKRKSSFTLIRIMERTTLMMRSMTGSTAMTLLSFFNRFSNLFCYS